MFIIVFTPTVGLKDCLTKYYTSVDGKIINKRSVHISVHLNFT